MILILSLSLILILSTTALSLPEVHAEDLKCLNDYESEMVCRLDLGKLQSCSEFSLTANLSTSKSFTCSFQLVSQDSCECQFQVKGFVSGETFFTELWKGGVVLVTKEMQTFKIIKPKKPINVSVEVTENVDFRISWSHNYTSTQKPFVESLRTNLSYGLKGSKDRVSDLVKHERIICTVVINNMIMFFSTENMLSLSPGSSCQQRCTQYFLIRTMFYVTKI
uniref:Interleukin-4 receptor subunit alpha n=1 Tax=Astyanax mexicanus TaxID=7994 RepID=A0A3B1IYP4_ASTMX